MRTNIYIEHKEKGLGPWPIYLMQTTHLSLAADQAWHVITDHPGPNRLQRQLTYKPVNIRMLVSE